MSVYVTSGSWRCWAVCTGCGWQGPRHAGNANRAHDAAVANLGAHVCRTVAPALDAGDDDEGVAA